MPWKKKKSLSLDKKTGVLAGLALLTAGAVFVGEALRFLSRKDEPLHPQALKESVGDAPLAGYQQTPSSEKRLFLLLSGFLAGFAGSRAISHGIRDGWWPVGNTYIKNRHVHHFLPGIVLAFLAGSGGLITADETVEAPLSFLMGTGIGMTLDEASLLLELKDVYWSEEGLFSLQASLVFATLLGGTIIVFRIFRRGEEQIEGEDFLEVPESV